VSGVGSYAKFTAQPFEAGDHGLELLIFGPPHNGDPLLDPEFWPREATPQ
jgi:hypothetical protein